MPAAVTGQPTRAWVEQIMGMPVSIHLRGPGLRGSGLGGSAADGAAPDTRVEAAVAAAFAALRRVDELFSTWRPGSQVSRLARGELSVAKCDASLRDVVRLCETAREATDGWFDAGSTDGAGRVFDPTGLVKGWAVQRVCVDLAGDLAEHDVLVNAGGDIAVSCGRSDTPPWQLGIEDPADTGRVLAHLQLRSGGLATSGTAARGGHIYSPATGLAADALASVSVIGPSLLWADVYATAAFARGPECVEWLRTLTDHAWLVVDLDGATISSFAPGA